MLKNVRVPLGTRPLILINLGNAAAQCPSFLSGNKISLSVSHSSPAFSLLFLPFLFTHLHFSFICFPLLLRPQIFESVSFHLLVRLFRSLLWSYRHYYCALVSFKSPHWPDLPGKHTSILDLHSYWALHGRGLLQCAVCVRACVRVHVRACVCVCVIGEQCLWQLWKYKSCGLWSPPSHTFSYSLPL